MEPLEMHWLTQPGLRLFYCLLRLLFDTPSGEKQIKKMPGVLLQIIVILHQTAEFAVCKLTLFNAGIRRSNAGISFYCRSKFGFITFMIIAAIITSTIALVGLPRFL